MGSGGHPKLLPRKLGRLMHVHPINVIVVVGARRASRVEVLHPIARWLQAWYNESFTYFESFTGYNTYAHYKLDRISYQRCNPVTTEYIYHVFFSMMVLLYWRNVDYVRPKTMHVKIVSGYGNRELLLPGVLHRAHKATVILEYNAC